MWYAERPRSLGPAPIGWYSLVASTILSRRPLPWASQRPMYLLGDPVTLLHVRGLRAAVNIGGIDEVDAGIQSGVQHGEAVRLTGHHAKVHRAQPDPAHLQTGTTQIAVLHADPFFTRRPQPRETDFLFDPTTANLRMGVPAVRGNGRDSQAPRIGI